MIVVVVATHSLWGKGKEFQGLEEKLIVSLQTENEPLKKKTLGHQTFSERIKRSASKWAKYQNLEGWREYLLQRMSQGFPGGAVVESLPANAGDTGSSPGLGRSHMPRSN